MFNKAKVGDYLITREGGLAKLFEIASGANHYKYEIEYITPIHTPIRVSATGHVFDKHAEFTLDIIKVCGGEISPHDEEFRLKTAINHLWT